MVLKDQAVQVDLIVLLAEEALHQPELELMVVLVELAQEDQVVMAQQVQLLHLQ
jgi:hypothetical protein